MGLSWSEGMELLKVEQKIEDNLKETKQVEQDKRLDKIEIIEGWKIGAQFLSRQGELFTVFQLNPEVDTITCVTEDGIYLSFTYNGDSLSTLNGIEQNLVKRTSSLDRRRS